MFTVSVQIRGSIIQRKNELKDDRNVKHFSEQKFLKELQGLDFENICKHDHVSEAYSNFV
jgi:hypothetical protein